MPHARRDNSERPGNANAPATISICARRDKSAGAPHFFAALTSFPEVHFDRDQDQGRKAANRRKRRSTSPRGIAIFTQPMPSSGRREVRQTSGPANYSGRARAADADLRNSLQISSFRRTAAVRKARRTAWVASAFRTDCPAPSDGLCLFLPDETILRNPRNHPETNAGYLCRQQSGAKTPGGSHEPLNSLSGSRDAPENRGCRSRGRHRGGWLRYFRPHQCGLHPDRSRH